MAQEPIGINFIPNQENQEMGPRRGALEGDLQQAWKILSLRLPRILSARSPLNPTLARGMGSQGMGMNPNASIFEAMVRSMIPGGGARSMVPGGGTAPPPQFEYGDRPGGGPTSQPLWPAAPPPVPAPSSSGGQQGAPRGSFGGGGSRSPFDPFDPSGGSRYGRR